MYIVYWVSNYKKDIVEAAVGNQNDLFHLISALDKSDYCIAWNLGSEYDISNLGWGSDWNKYCNNFTKEGIFR